MSTVSLVPERKPLARPPTDLKVTDKRPQFHQVDSTNRSLTPIDVRLDDFRTLSFGSTISDAPTAIRRETLTTPRPTYVPHESPNLPTTSRPIYSPHESPNLPASPRPVYLSHDSVPYESPGLPTTPQSIYLPHESPNRTTDSGAVDVNEAVHASYTSSIVRFNEEQIRDNQIEASRRERMAIDLESSPPTPTVDDTPFIRFAIEQLTRDEEVRAAAGRPQTSTSSNTSPVERLVYAQGLEYNRGSGLTREELALARKHRSSPNFEPETLFKFNPTRPLSCPPNPPEYQMSRYSGTEVFIPVNRPLHSSRYPELTFVPTILRLPSMITLSSLCAVMITALIFCAVYSTNHNGLVAWSGGIHGGLYFVFGFLPQILASIIFLYVQGVVSAITRILPFTLMAMRETESRTNALFLGLYPKSFFWPGGDGPTRVYVSNLFFWLATFTIPLQCSLFSVIFVAGEWRWTAVQSVAWALVTIYAVILIATVLSGMFFFRRTTGLLWDPRSLADIIAMLPRSNSLQDYPGTEIMKSRGELRDRLVMRSDRLGYWRTQDQTQGVFYCLGEEGTPTRRYTLEAGKLHEKLSNAVFDDSSDLEKSADLYSRATRFRHLPWQLGDTFVILWAVAAFILLLALLIVSFLPSTAIRKGFPPRVSALPNDQGFSPANFLYSFVPSLLGMILYLLFQPLDMSLRKLQPWKELGNPHGATAGKSLLLDYSAALPVQCSWNAFKAGHHRVASISALSLVFILLPVLAGGIFFPLTMSSNEVCMMPNLPSFYVVLTVLVLYVAALVALIPERYQMRLPHAVDCPAEIFSFVYNSGMLTDAAFRAPRTKQDLVTRLTASSAAGQKGRYTFGLYRGRNGKESLGIERISRRGAQEVMVLSGR